jgi:ribonucleotide reductase beta subunit family protein with ferritin-like domain
MVESGTHVPLFKNIFRTAVNEVGIDDQTKNKIRKMIIEMTDIEKEWTKYLSKDLLGFSDRAIDMYVEYKANEVAENLNLDPIYEKTDGGPLMMIELERSMLAGEGKKANFFETTVSDYAIGYMDEDY